VIFFYAYLVTLFLAPQVWLPPFVNLPVDYILYPGWLIYVVMSGRFLRIKYHVAETFFGAFIFWICVSLVLNGSAYNFVPIVLAKYVKWFLLYLLIRATVTTVRDLRRVAVFLVLLIYVLVVEGIQHKLDPAGINWAGQPLGWVVPEVRAAGGTGRTRWVGVFDGIGVFTVAYTIALPFVLHYASSGFKPAVRWLNRLGLPFLLLAIYYTGSRGGFIATLVLICLHLAVTYRVSLKSILIASALVTIAITAAPSNLTQTKDSMGSAQNRVDVWAQGLSMVADSPLWGIGRGNYVGQTHTIIAHNSALEILGETGLVGVLLWASLITVCLRAAYLRYQSTTAPLDRRVVSGLMASVIGYMASSMFVTLEYETFYLLLALCAGITVPGTQGQLYRRKEFVLCCSVVAAFVVAIKALVMVY
jgi:O-antigen ligase